MASRLAIRSDPTRIYNTPIARFNSRSNIYWSQTHNKLLKAFLASLMLPADGDVPTTVYELMPIISALGYANHEGAMNNDGVPILDILAVKIGRRLKAIRHVHGEREIVNVVDEIAQPSPSRKRGRNVPSTPSWAVSKFFKTRKEASPTTPSLSLSSLDTPDTSLKSTGYSQHSDPRHSDPHVDDDDYMNKNDIPLRSPLFEFNFRRAFPPGIRFSAEKFMDVGNVAFPVQGALEAKGMDCDMFMSMEMSPTGLNGVSFTDNGSFESLDVENFDFTGMNMNMTPSNVPISNMDGTGNTAPNNYMSTISPNKSPNTDMFYPYIPVASSQLISTIPAFVDPTQTMLKYHGLPVPNQLATHAYQAHDACATQGTQGTQITQATHATHVPHAQSQNSAFTWPNEQQSYMSDGESMYPSMLAFNSQDHSQVLNTFTTTQDQCQAVNTFTSTQAQRNFTASGSSSMHNVAISLTRATCMGNNSYQFPGLEMHPSASPAVPNASYPSSEIPTIGMATWMDNTRQHPETPTFPVYGNGSMRPSTPYPRPHLTSTFPLITNTNNIVSILPFRLSSHNSLTSSLESPTSYPEQRAFIISPRLRQARSGSGSPILALSPAVSVPTPDSPSYSLPFSPISPLSPTSVPFSPIASSPAPASPYSAPYSLLPSILSAPVSGEASRSPSLNSDEVWLRSFGPYWVQLQAANELAREQRDRQQREIELWSRGIHLDSASASPRPLGAALHTFAGSDETANDGIPSPVPSKVYSAASLEFLKLFNREECLDGAETLASLRHNPRVTANFNQISPQSETHTYVPALEENALPADDAWKPYNATGCDGFANSVGNGKGDWVFTLDESADDDDNDDFDAEVDDDNADDENKEF